MLWGDFLFRRIKFELKLIGENIPLIGLAAFLCIMGGILLWISGGSYWFAVRVGTRGGFTLSLVGAFTLWLICYGLVGVSLALIGFICNAGICCDKRCIKSFALLMISYLLMLSWYAIFFCTRLIVFPLILLICSVLLVGISFLLIRKTLCLLFIINLIIEIIQIYFIFFSISILR